MLLFQGLIHEITSQSVDTELQNKFLLNQVHVLALRLLKHGDECFEPAACPCLWKGKEYYPGDRVSSPCHQWYLHSLMVDIAINIIRVYYTTKVQCAVLCVST